MAVGGDTLVAPFASNMTTTSSYHEGETAYGQLKPQGVVPMIWRVWRGSASSLPVADCECDFIACLL